MAPLATVLGVDGAAGGWAIAELNPATGDLTMAVVESIAPSIARIGNDVSIVAIDMPIGLPPTDGRSVDAQARKRLAHRRSTFFPTPIRGVLGCDSFDEANSLSKATTGKGLSIQAWNLVPKIAEVDGLWRPKHHDTLFEAHPELSFAELAGQPLDSKKPSAEGREERLELLARQFPDAREAVGTLANKWRIDAIDALVLAWTAARVRAGRSVVLGGELDAEGRPMRLAI